MARRKHKRPQPTLPPAPPSLMLADGPTDEQQRRAAYRRDDQVARVERAIRNEWESPLRVLEWWGSITARQREAGELFERDYRIANPVGGTRDTLDMSPRGLNHETESAAEREAKARARVRQVHDAAGIWYTALRELCVFRQRVKSAAVTMPPVLDRVGDVYGLPRRD